MKSAVAIVTFCAVLSGCAVQLHGNQATSGGTTTTTTSSAVVASASGANARVGFFSGQPVSPGAPGGQLNLSGSGGNIAAVLLVGAVVVEFLNSLGGAAMPQVKPLPPDTRISHTCSCYGWQPPRERDDKMTRCMMKLPAASASSSHPPVYPREIRSPRIPATRTGSQKRKDGYESDVTAFVRSLVQDEAIRDDQRWAWERWRNDESKS